MKLTRSILYYWWHYIKVSEFVQFVTGPNKSMWTYNEGMIEYHSYTHGTLRYMTFWYILNHEWYKMNNKKFADTNCKQEYTQPMDECLE